MMMAMPMEADGGDGALMEVDITWDRFGVDLGPFWVPFWAPKSAEVRSSTLISHRTGRYELKVVPSRSESSLSAHFDR